MENPLRNMVSAELGTIGMMGAFHAATEATATHWRLWYRKHKGVRLTREEFLAALTALEAERSKPCPPSSTPE